MCLEPDFPYMEALSPYQPLLMRVVYCPIDTSLNFSQANKLLKDLKPKNLVIPQSYTSPPPLLKNRTDLVIDCEATNVFAYKRNYVIKLPIKRKFERIDIDSDVSPSHYLFIKLIVCLTVSLNSASSGGALRC